MRNWNITRRKSEEKRRDGRPLLKERAHTLRGRKLALFRLCRCAASEESSQTFGDSACDGCPSTQRLEDGVAGVFNATEDSSFHVVDFAADCFPRVIQSLFNAMRLAASNFPDFGKFLRNALHIEADGFQRAYQGPAIIDQTIHLVRKSPRHQVHRDKHTCLNNDRKRYQNHRNH